MPTFICFIFFFFHSFDAIASQVSAKMAKIILKQNRQQELITISFVRSESASFYFRQRRFFLWWLLKNKFGKLTLLFIVAPAHSLLHFILAVPHKVSQIAHQRRIAQLEFSFQVDLLGFFFLHIFFSCCCEISLNMTRVCLSLDVQLNICSVVCFNVFST